MSFSLFMVLAAGALQLIVAAYALRLNRLFGTARVGWSLFGAFSLMALLHAVQGVIPWNLDHDSGIRVEGLYALVSLLLLASLAHLETLLREKGRIEIKERQMRVELEAEVKKKSAYLLRAIEGLQAEADERKQLEASMRYKNPVYPGLLESFLDMLAQIPDTALARTLTRESYMLGVDLAEHRPLPPVEVGSILVFSHFVEMAGQTGGPLSPVVLPPAHVAAYRRILGRLITCRVCLPDTMKDFESVFGGNANSNATHLRSHLVLSA